MQYQVPQFIEVEDRIIGPLTLKQFIYLAGSAGLCVVFFFNLPFVVALLLGLPVAGLGGALAFYKVNGKPFIEILEAGFNYLFGKKLFLWRRHDPTLSELQTAAQAAAKEAEARAAAEQAAKTEPKLTRSKLSELAWSLDAGKNTNTGEPASS